MKLGLGNDLIVEKSMRQILQEIAEENSLVIHDFQSLSGGDINAVYLLNCSQGSFVIKLNDAIKFPKMFDAEAKGLQLLATSNSFRIPKVFASGNANGQSYLLLEYIEKGTETPKFWSLFAEKLTKLHEITQINFGLDHDNYIGSLKQANGLEKTSADFFIHQRLEPQFNLALKNGFSSKNLAVFFQNISVEIPAESPALLHGDLWSGNYLVSAKGYPVLIDPAVAFAPRELDLAMMKLFGGFPQEVFNVYNEISPLEKGWQERIPIFQLYYLLVHLNIFGARYLPQVKTIVNQFS